MKSMTNAERKALLVANAPIAPVLSKRGVQRLWRIRKAIDNFFEDDKESSQELCNALYSAHSEINKLLGEST